MARIEYGEEASMREWKRGGAVTGLYLKILSALVYKLVHGKDLWICTNMSRCGEKWNLTYGIKPVPLIAVKKEAFHIGFSHFFWDKRVFFCLFGFLPNAFLVISWFDIQYLV